MPLPFSAANKKNKITPMISIVPSDILPASITPAKEERAQHYAHSNSSTKSTSHRFFVAVSTTALI